MSEVLTSHGPQVSSVPPPEAGSLFDVATHAPALPDHLSHIHAEGGPIRRAGPVRVGEDPRLLKHLDMLRALDAEAKADGLEDVRAELTALEPTPVEPTPVATPIPAA